MKIQFKILVVCMGIYQMDGMNIQEKPAEWVNWAGNQRCNPQQIAYPKSRQELIDFVKKVQNTKQTVKVAAGGHSWSDIVCGDYLVDLKYMNRILVINKRKKQIKVEAGITLEKLNEELERVGLALPNQGAIMVQSIAGVVSTATHGTGHTGTFSDFIVSMELLTADGKILVLSPTIHPEWFKAAKVGIGALGIIVSLTLQCVPAFTLVEAHEIIPLSELFERYKEIHQENDYFLFDAHLLEGRASITRWNRVPQQKGTQRAQTSYKALSSFTTGGKRYEEEIAIRADSLPQALEALKQLYRKYQRLGNYSIGDMHCRFVNADMESYLSPTARRDTVYLSISTPPEDRYMKFYRDFENTLLPYGGRPHWGKINFLTYSKALKLYGSGLTEFIAVKNQLDPQGLFSNAFTRRIFKR
jgi:L-gulono-1,4-lactone dehydrogenase